MRAPAAELHDGHLVSSVVEGETPISATLVAADRTASTAMRATSSASHLYTPVEIAGERDRSGSQPATAGCDYPTEPQPWIAHRRPILRADVCGCQPPSRPLRGRHIGCLTAYMACALWRTQRLKESSISLLRGLDAAVTGAIPYSPASRNIAHHRRLAKPAIDRTMTSPNARPTSEVTTATAGRITGSLRPCNSSS